MKALVLMNMGGAHNLDEVEVFLKNMFNDENILTIKNPLLRKFVAFMITTYRKKEARKNYELIGGKSPINLHTKDLINKLSSYLPNFCITQAMRYTPPFAKDAIKELKEKGVKEVFLFPLYPHYSTTTTKSSLEDFYKSAKELNFNPKILKIDRFYKNRLYNEAVFEKIQKVLKKDNPKEFDLIFSAHSLPQKIVNSGDPYEKEVKEHSRILQELLKKEGIVFNDYHLAYQSKLGPVKWLEPSLEQKLKEIKNKKVIIYPISFILDNSETDFELSIEYKKIAKDLGFNDYRVCECLNDSDKFCEAVRDIVEKNEI